MGGPHLQTPLAGGGGPAPAGRLSNGMSLFTHHVPHTRSLTLLVLVRVGSRDETPGLYGASHHLEHMLFKGTSAFPSARSITSILDALGASYNASTSYDYTSYYITVPSEHVEKAFIMLSEMVRFPLLKDEEMDKERWVVIEEIHRQRDNPAANVMNLASGRVFEGNSLGRSIAGEVDDVAKHDPDLVRQFWSQHYVPERMVAIVCGNHPDAATAAQFGRLARRYAEYYLAAAEGAPLRTPAGQRRR